MGERMFKTLITHYILETCINVLMLNVKNNFTQIPKPDNPRTHASRNQWHQWKSLTYGNGLFVAVASSGTYPDVWGSFNHD